MSIEAFFPIYANYFWLSLSDKLPDRLKKTIDFIIKYKLYHLLFWFVYHYFWWSVTVGSPIDAVNNIFFSPYSTKFAFYVVMQALGVYFNLYFLIPKFLRKGKYVSYISLFLITILATSALIIGGYYVNAFVTGIPFEELFKIAPHEYITLFKSNALPSTAASMTLAMSIKLTKSWIASEKHRNTIEKEKLETELKFLRSQFNPHFLFNTINSIFVLIHKNPDMASESLAKFSDLMRYQLYQCNETFIALEKELDYLENYINLEKLRQDNNNMEMYFELEKTGASSWNIAPFLLIPFIENAFKHISHHKNAPNWIRMALHIRNNTLTFKIANSINKLETPNHEGKSGIGLANVKRRLELLYPNSHILEVYSDDLQFKVSLSLQLNRSEEIIKSKIA